jgi:eukaryotic-like serine/threonine-protein kinase
VYEVAFTPDGRELDSAATDGTVRTWDVGLAERRGLLRGHTDFVYDVAYHPDNRRVLSASWDGTAAVWDTATGRLTQRLAHPARTGGANGKDRVNYVNTVAVHPNGRLAATVGRLDAVLLWDLTSPEENPPPLHTWTVPTDDWRVTRVAFRPTGTLLACGGKGGKVRLFDWKTKAAVAELDHPGAVVEGIAFSPGGRWLVSSSAETVRVWDADTWRLAAELVGHTEGVNGFAFSPDGRTLASAASDGTVRLWHVGEWTAGAVLRHGGVKVYSVAFHPDGHILATGCSDSSLRVWNVPGGQEVAELRGHLEYVHAVAFSPDGKRLVSGSGDKTLRVWDTVPVRAAGR